MKLRTCLYYRLSHKREHCPDWILPIIDYVRYEWLWNDELID